MTSFKKHFKKHAQVCSLLLLIVLATSSAFGARRKLSPELEAKSANLGSTSGAQSAAEFIDVIVQARPGAPLSQHRQKMVSLGATQKKSLDIINGSVFRIPAKHS